MEPTSDKAVNIACPLHYHTLYLPGTEDLTGQLVLDKTQHKIAHQLHSAAACTVKPSNTLNHTSTHAVY
jgi:hypothetical protein